MSLRRIAIAATAALLLGSLIWSTVSMKPPAAHGASSAAHARVLPRHVDQHGTRG